MAYVMVPVPEEFVTDVMQMVVRFGIRAQQTPWDQEGVAQLWDDSDEAAKTLLSIVSRGTLAQGQIVENEVAEQMQMQVREVHGIIRELADWAEENNRSSPLLTRKQAETLSSGRTRERRVLYMDRLNAEWLRDIERAEAEANPHALKDLGG